jgi:hypothetical protein
MGPAPTAPAEPKLVQIAPVATTYNGSAPPMAPTTLEGDTRTPEGFGEDETLP